MTQSACANSDTASHPIRWFSSPALRYPWAYLALVAVSAMDVVMTAIILAIGGNEVNPVASLVIDHWGMTGAIPFKFGLTLFIIIVCEEAGRKKPRDGRNLLVLAIVVSAMPVVYSLGLIGLHAIPLA